MLDDMFHANIVEGVEDSYFLDQLEWKGIPEDKKPAVNKCLWQCLSFVRLSNFCPNESVYEEQQKALLLRMNLDMRSMIMGLLIAEFKRRHNDRELWYRLYNIMHVLEFVGRMYTFNETAQLYKTLCDEYNTHQKPPPLLWLEKLQKNDIFTRSTPKIGNTAYYKTVFQTCGRDGVACPLCLEPSWNLHDFKEHLSLMHRNYIKQKKEQRNKDKNQKQQIHERDQSDTKMAVDSGVGMEEEDEESKMAMESYPKDQQTKPRQLAKKKQKIWVLEKVVEKLTVAERDNIRIDYENIMDLRHQIMSQWDDNADATKQREFFVVFLDTKEIFAQKVNRFDIRWKDINPHLITSLCRQWKDEISKFGQAISGVLSLKGAQKMDLDNSSDNNPSEALPKQKIRTIPFEGPFQPKKEIERVIPYCGEEAKWSDFIKRKVRDAVIDPDALVSFEEVSGDNDLMESIPISVSGNEESDECWTQFKGQLYMFHQVLHQSVSKASQKPIYDFLISGIMESPISSNGPILKENMRKFLIDYFKFLLSRTPKYIGQMDTDNETDDVFFEMENGIQFIEIMHFSEHDIRLDQCLHFLETSPLAKEFEKVFCDDIKGADDDSMPQCFTTSLGIIAIKAGYEHSGILHCLGKAAFQKGIQIQIQIHDNMQLLSDTRIHSTLSRWNIKQQGCSFNKFNRFLYSGER